MRNRQTISTLLLIASIVVLSGCVPADQREAQRRNVYNRQRAILDGRLIEVRVQYNPYMQYVTPPRR